MVRCKCLHALVQTGRLDWGHRVLAPPATLTVDGLRAWFADHDVAGDGVGPFHRRSPGCADDRAAASSSPRSPSTIYREAVYIFYGKLSVACALEATPARPGKPGWVEPPGQPSVAHRSRWPDRTQMGDPADRHLRSGSLGELDGQARGARYGAGHGCRASPPTPPSWARRCAGSLREAPCGPLSARVDGEEDAAGNVVVGDAASVSRSRPATRGVPAHGWLRRDRRRRACGAGGGCRQRCRAG